MNDGILFTILQIEKLYGRRKVSQFPSPGLSIEDSFFSREQNIQDHPFRLYCGISAPGQSMKTVLLRTYAVLLQATEKLKDDPELVNYIDPYRTLIGYFNSIRELGGAVRLLDDDVEKRLETIRNLYNYKQQRYIKRYRELTSRISSDSIPRILSELERTMFDEYPLDVALATNMISVGMDVVIRSLERFILMSSLCMMLNSLSLFIER